MKYLITTILSLYTFCTIHAQVEDCLTCPCIIELGDKYTQKREYANAIDMYNAATACDINLKDEVNQKIKIVFKKIERERDNAVAAERRAVKAEEKVAEALKQAQVSEQNAIDERNKAKIAESEAQKQKKNAEEQVRIAKEKTENLQVVLDALYFFEDSLALAYKKYKGFGFINKEGKVLIDYKYDEVLPFNNRGYAKVKRDDIDYLIDTQMI